MAPPSWADEEQQNFLKSHMDDFYEAQQAGKLPLFWPKVQNMWYKKWPEPGMDGGPPADSSKDLTACIQDRNKVRMTKLETYLIKLMALTETAKLVL